MALSRRELLTVLASSKIGLAQVAVNGSTLSSSSGLRLKMHGDPQRPAVAVYLPGTSYPSAVIEMPEHAWRKEREGDQQSWFYKMYASDPAQQGKVVWASNANTLSYSMKTPSGFTLNSKARLEADGVAIEHEVISNSVSRLAAVEAPTCIKLYRPFSDVFLERTYVHHADGLDLVASETPDRLEKNAEEWLPCRYIVQVGTNSPGGETRVERLDDVTRYFKSRAANAAFIATESHPGGWTAATHALHCDSVFTNPARTCHHADPRALSITDGRAHLRLKFYLLRGSVKDAWNVVSKRNAAAEV